jgi:ABC-2 type transport system ATP-binding protein
MTIGKDHHMSTVSAADIAPTAYAWEIRANGLKVKVGKKRMAVDGLDLSLGTGVHGLLGPNGAGKTTLIRALATVLRPAAGTLELLGESVGGRGEHRALRRRIGYLPQEFGYYKRFTVREFVEYMAWLKEVPKADIPTAGLDPAQRVRFRQLLQELGTDTCVVVSTHLVEDVAAACTDVVLFAEGRLVFQGTPDELAAAGGPEHVGDSPLERGYAALLQGSAGERGAW